MDLIAECDKLNIARETTINKASSHLVQYSCSKTWFARFYKICHLAVRSIPRHARNRSIDSTFAGLPAIHRHFVWILITPEGRTCENSSFLPRAATASLSVKYKWYRDQIGWNLEIFKNNFTAGVFALCRPQHHGSTRKGTN